MPTRRHAHGLSCLFAALCLTGAVASCKRGGATPQAATPADVQGPAAPIARPPAIAQDPPPPELQLGLQQFLTGQYESAIATLTPLAEASSSPSQQRTAGLAKAYLALTHAQDVIENAEGPSARALELAEALADDVLTRAARCARAAYLLGTEDFDAAMAMAEQAEDSTAADAPPDEGLARLGLALARLLRAEALLGRAFGGDEGSSLKRPDDLVTAATHYQQVVVLLERAQDPGALALVGRAHEGLAAVAKYRGQAPELCRHAAAAIERFNAAVASEYLRDGPETMLREGKCKAATP